jgi:hypothetical protein
MVVLNAERSAGLYHSWWYRPAKMQASRFLFSSVEQATIARILRDFPQAAQALEVGIRPIVDRLAKECRGLLRSKGRG